MLRMTLKEEVSWEFGVMEKFLKGFKDAWQAEILSFELVKCIFSKTLVPEVEVYLIVTFLLLCLRNL